MNLISGIKGILYKEFISEFRSSVNTSSIIIFSVISVIISSFSFGELLNSANVFSSIYWIIIFFTAMNSIPRSFISDVETGVAILLKLNSDSLAVYLGKLIYNFLNCVLIAFFTGFSLWIISGISIQFPVEFIIISLLICLSFSSACTMLSAIIAFSSKRSSLLPLLAFPVLAPIIYLGIDVSILAIVGNYINYYDILFLFLFPVVLISISIILFDFIWED